MAERPQPLNDQHTQREHPVLPAQIKPQTRAACLSDKRRQAWLMEFLIGRSEHPPVRRTACSIAHLRQQLVGNIMPRRRHHCQHYQGKTPRNIDHAKRGRTKQIQQNHNILFPFLCSTSTHVLSPFSVIPHMHLRAFFCVVIFVCLGLGPEVCWSFMCWARFNLLRKHGWEV